MRTLRMVLPALWLMAGSASLNAQQGWGVALEIGSAGFSGHSGSTGDTPESSGRPAGTSTWGVLLDRTGRAVRFSVGARVASTGVMIEDDEISVEARDVLTLLEIAPEAAVTVLRPEGGAIRLHVGVVVDRWSADGVEARTRVGGLGGVSLEMPLARRIGIQVRWDASITGSVFRDEDLPADFERRSGRRTRWSLGARYRL